MRRYGYQSPEDASETIHETSWISTTVYVRGRKTSSLIRVRSEVIQQNLFSRVTSFTSSFTFFSIFQSFSSCPLHYRRQLWHSYHVIIHEKHPHIKIIVLIQPLFTTSTLNEMVGRNSSVGIATRYGLDDPGIESRWGRDFPNPSRPALGPSQPPIKWVPVLIAGSKAAGA